MNINDPFDGNIGISIDAFLADSAQVSEGKISVLGGGWDRINVTALPAVLPVISLVMFVRTPYSETEKDHSMTIELHDEDGAVQPMMGMMTQEGQMAFATNIDVQFRVERNPAIPVGDDYMMPMAFPVQNLSFNKFGLYSWVLSVDGVPVTRIPLRVAQTQ